MKKRDCRLFGLTEGSGTLIRRESQNQCPMKSGDIGATGTPVAGERAHAVDRMATAVLCWKREHAVDLLYQCAEKRGGTIEQQPAVDQTNLRDEWCTIERGKVCGGNAGGIDALRRAIARVCIPRGQADFAGIDPDLKHAAERIGKALAYFAAEERFHNASLSARAETVNLCCDRIVK